MLFLDNMLSKESGKYPTNLVYSQSKSINSHNSYGQESVGSKC
jgi:hypothetical protein